MATDVGPSATARRVAAYRLGFERVPAAYGDPDADDRLARDVAGGEVPSGSEGMARYLRGRTAFFDRVVVNAVDRDVTQIVSVGAGYDGRAFRYARPDVRWWEVDRAPTQSDKCRRLARLGVDAAHVCFVPFDLAGRGLAGALAQAGYEPDVPGLFTCEGVAVYLDLPTLEALLDELRSLATVGTRLAFSVSSSPSSADHAARRARFEAVVAELGEPARSAISTADVAPILAANRWRPADVSERSARAGFVVALPVWSPSAASATQTATRSRVGTYLERMLYRPDTAGLSDHLNTVTGVAVKSTKQMDLGVHRVDLVDGSRWIARLFPATRPLDAVEGDADVLRWLEENEFPAERCASLQPVSMFAGHPLLVTSFVSGGRVRPTTETFTSLGHLLARLHSLEPRGAARRPGGAWHHLVNDAGLSEESAAASELFHAARHRTGEEERPLYDELAADLAELGAVTDWNGLPHAFAHPDPVPLNLIANVDDEMTFVDWTGAGWAPRVASLGCLLWAASAAGPAAVDAVAIAYRSDIQVERKELDDLPLAMRIRPLVLTCWTIATGRGSVTDGAARWKRDRARINRSARRARELLQQPV